LANLARTNQAFLAIGRIAAAITQTSHTRCWTTDFANWSWNTHISIAVRAFSPKIARIGGHDIGAGSALPNQWGQDDGVTWALLRAFVLVWGVGAVTTIRKTYTVKANMTLLTICRRGARCTGLTRTFG
tara:strand:+ start:213 stop:599 length:387 start_codon:yes stop_codon:yes gene_type:complete